MTIEEIEVAITQLSPADLDKLVMWVEKFRATSQMPTGSADQAYLTAVESTLAVEWGSEEDNRAYNDL